MSDTITINNGRHYIIKEGLKTFYLPSVTTIIGFNSDDTWLIKWRERIGEKEADAISKFSANRGTCMHLFCEYYFDSKEVAAFSSTQLALNFDEVEIDLSNQEAPLVIQNDEVKVANAKGDAVTTKDALTQFGDLLLRTNKQAENIKAIQALQQPATDELKSCAPTVKPKASKSLKSVPTLLRPLNLF